MSQQRQIDDNQDDLGRNVNDPSDRIGDRATLDKTKPTTRKDASERSDEKKKSDEPEHNVSGGFNQKSKPR